MLRRDIAGVKSFRYAHRAALEVATLREREASLAFARAREANARAADACARVGSDATFARADASRRVRTSSPLSATSLLVSERALEALAARQRAARDGAAASESRLADARAELATCARKRDAFARHRARAADAHALRCERAEERACDEAAALAYGARARRAGSPGA